MGQGVGRTLLEHVLETLEAGGAQRLQIESDPHAEAFYRHMGAKRVGEIVYELEGQPRLLPLLVIELTPK
jgi:predicted GNAT family N-acyltransferase